MSKTTELRDYLDSIFEDGQRVPFESQTAMTERFHLSLAYIRRIIESTGRVAGSDWELKRGKS